jgi:hypothetical protein
MLAGLAPVVAAVVVAAAASATPATVNGRVAARVGTITARASSLHRGPSGSFISDLLVTTSASASDELDAAVASGDTAVGVYHQAVSVGEIPDLAGCDGDRPPPSVVDDWLHYGPLLVPGRTSGPAPPANATLTVSTPGGGPSSGNMVVTLYFAHAGQLTLDLPVRRS